MNHRCAKIPHSKICVRGIGFEASNFVCDKKKTCDILQMSKKTVYFYPSWAIYGRKFEIDQVPAALITHLHYAFAEIQKNKLCVLDPWADTDRRFQGDAWDKTDEVYGNFGQLFKLKLAHRHLKTMITVGGWGKSHTFSDTLATDQTRGVFVQSCIEFVQRYGFDGIDFDWEYPGAEGAPGHVFRPEDNANFVKFLRLLRQQAPEKMLISIAVPANKTVYQKMILSELAQSVDYINVMGYDFVGGWSKVSGHQSNLFSDAHTQMSVDDCVSALLAKGVPADKIILGVPFYARGFKDTNGLHQGHAGLPSGDRPDDPGVKDYKSLSLDNVSYDAVLGASYMHNQRELWTFDSPKVLEQKCKYIDAKQLGGIMAWDITGDHPVSDPRSLVRQIAAFFKNRLDKGWNRLNYHDSDFANIRQFAPVAPVVAPAVAPVASTVSVIGCTCKKIQAVILESLEIKNVTYKNVP